MPCEQVNRILEAFIAGGAAGAAPSGGEGSNNGTPEDQISSIASTSKRPIKVVVECPSGAIPECLMRRDSKN